jgi:phosphoribosylamine--glycine ligase
MQNGLQVVRWCKETEVGLVFIGPEAPLVAGLVDALKASGIRQAPNHVSIIS